MLNNTSNDSVKQSVLSVDTMTGWICIKKKVTLPRHSTRHVCKEWVKGQRKKRLYTNQKIFL